MGLFDFKKLETGHIQVLAPGKGSAVIKLPFVPTTVKAYMVDSIENPSCRPMLDGKIETSIFKKRMSWFIKVSWENLEPGHIEWVAKNYDESAE